AEATPVYIRGEEQNGFKITPDQLEQAITSKTKILILNSPSNPTGAVYSKEELIAIGSICEKYQLWIISDEIYEKLIYDNIEHVSIASLSKALYNKTFVINGMSKPYSMTGWRIGYAAGNEEVISAMTDLSSHSTSNPTSIAQYAALEALEGTQQPLHSMKEAFKIRRNLIVSLLDEIPGINCFVPEGAFYVFINMNNVIVASSFSDVDQWAKQLLETGHVAVIPGSGFGAPEFIRLSYTVSADEIEIGIKNIRKFIENNTK
ncbi:MAG: pyridoxal phosphate-dependent aminotransferase, partial [Bacilli bacterium]